MKISSYDKFAVYIQMHPNIWLNRIKINKKNIKRSDVFDIILF